MGREVRMVSRAWGHPKDTAGRFIPLFEGPFLPVWTEWEIGRVNWDKGRRVGWGEQRWIDAEDYSWEDWAGLEPERRQYMPEWARGDIYMMYETCSEGTPISPALETAWDLACWLDNNDASWFGFKTASRKAWLNIINGGCSLPVFLVSEEQTTTRVGDG